MPLLVHSRYPFILLAPCSTYDFWCSANNTMYCHWNAKCIHVVFHPKASPSNWHYILRGHTGCFLRCTHIGFLEKALTVPILKQLVPYSLPCFPHQNLMLTASLLPLGQPLWKSLPTAGRGIVGRSVVKSKRIFDLLVNSISWRIVRDTSFLAF